MNDIEKSIGKLRHEIEHEELLELNKQLNAKVESQDSEIELKNIEISEMEKCSELLNDDVNEWKKTCKDLIAQNIERLSKLNNEKDNIEDQLCSLLIEQEVSHHTIIALQKYRDRLINKNEAQSLEIERLTSLKKATWDMYKHAKSLLTPSQCKELKQLLKNDEAAE